MIFKITFSFVEDFEQQSLKPILFFGIPQFLIISVFWKLK